MNPTISGSNVYAPGVTAIPHGNTAYTEFNIHLSYFRDIVNMN